MRRIALLDHDIGRLARGLPSKAIRDAGHERIGLDGQVIGRSIGREDAGVGLDRGRAAGALVRMSEIWLMTTSLPLSERADAERAGAEQHHQQRSGDPGQLASVQAAQDEVADRADEKDVGRRSRPAAARPAAPRASAGSPAPVPIALAASSRPGSRRRTARASALVRQQPRPEPRGAVPAAVGVGRHVRADEDDAARAERTASTRGSCRPRRDQGPRIVAKGAGRDGRRLDRRRGGARPGSERAVARASTAVRLVDRKEVGEAGGARLPVGVRR